MSTTSEGETVISVENKIKNGEYRVQAKCGKSDIWSRFHIVVDKDNMHLDYASCKSCKKILGYTGKTGTSGLRRHTCSTLLGQSTLSFKPKETETLPLKVKQDILQTCVNLCCKDIRPFDIVAGEGFIEFVEHIVDVTAKYKKFDVKKALPHPTTLSRHIESSAQSLQAKIISEMRPIIQVYGCAITSDIWTEDYHKTSFISATVHYINDEFQLKSRVLFAAPFENNVPKTGENIKSLLLTKLRAFGIDATLMSSGRIVFVTDRGANIVAALRGYTRLNCSAHILNVILSSAFSEKVLEKTPDLAELLVGAKRLVKYFKHSGLQNRLATSLKQSVETRWNSNYEMLNSILSQHETISALLVDTAHYEKIVQINLNHLETLVAFLKVFKDATNDLESDNCTTSASLVLPWSVTLQEHCQAAVQDPLLSEVAQVCVARLQELLSASNTTDKSLHMIYRVATMLTPKLRQLRMLDAHGRDQVMKGAKEIMQHMKLDVQQTEQSETATEDALGSLQPNAKKPATTGASQSRFTNWEDDAVSDTVVSKSFEEELFEFINSRLPESPDPDEAIILKRRGRQAKKKSRDPTGPVAVARRTGTKWPRDRAGTDKNASGSGGSGIENLVPCRSLASRRHPKQMPEPPQLAPLDVEEQRLYSEFLPCD
ncbi:hypothetical protein WMY93_026450 [Mugilogobius chulae]|uniref:BED-type domain-containing protein n=1 Tax=Mugilogobius chulae TaxID=88201 RepID=A0AAW0MYI5_9GOBI